MMGFTIDEILSSLLYASIYGVLYSAFWSLASLVCSVLSVTWAILRECFWFKKIFPLPDFRRKMDLHKRGRVFLLLAILLFALGFILISYFALDGEIRIYMLFISSAVLYLSNYVFCDFFGKIFLYLINRILQILCLLLRLIISPVFIILRCIKNKITKNVRN